MTGVIEHRHTATTSDGGPTQAPRDTASGYARNPLGNRFVYAVVSPRAHGLAVGVNLNPDKHCNFDCVYCEVNRTQPGRDQRLDVAAMVHELEHTLTQALAGKLRDLPGYSAVPAELLQLRHVSLSGDGEPTLSPQFTEALHSIIHLRARGKLPFFKLVLITNATGLDRPEVQQGLGSLTPKDEIWAKLDGGTQAYLDRINRTSVPIEAILGNILLVARRRPVVIQSLFPSVHGQEVPPEEIAAFVQRLRTLQAEGAQISLVQIYSAMRPVMHPECGHLSLRSLSKIAQTVRAETGLGVEVF